MLANASPFNSPYTRQTYRYTPLLALLLVPNEWVHISFGKYLFAGCDILAGILIYRLLISTVLPTLRKSPGSNPASTLSDKPSSSPISHQASLLTSIHLLNPLVFSISTRGSSESVLALFVLLTLYCALKSKWTLAALALGLSTHWKIYPFIYGAACVGVIGSEYCVGKGWKGWLRSVVNRRTVRFGVISVASFVGLNVVMYLMWVFSEIYFKTLILTGRILDGATRSCMNRTSTIFIDETIDITSHLTSTSFTLRTRSPETQPPISRSGERSFGPR